MEQVAKMLIEEPAPDTNPSPPENNHYEDKRSDRLLAVAAGGNSKTYFGQEYYYYYYYIFIYPGYAKKQLKTGFHWGPACVNIKIEYREYGQSTPK